MVSSLMFFNGQFIFTTILQVLSVLFSLFFVSLIPLPYLYIITEQSCLFSLFFLSIIPKINSSSLLTSRSVCCPCFSLFCRHQIYPKKNFIVNESAPFILLISNVCYFNFNCFCWSHWCFSPRFYPQYKMNPYFNFSLARLIAVSQNILFYPKG